MRNLWNSFSSIIRALVWCLRSGFGVVSGMSRSSVGGHLVWSSTGDGAFRCGDCVDFADVVTVQSSHAAVVARCRCSHGSGVVAPEPDQCRSGVRAAKRCRSRFGAVRAPQWSGHPTRWSPREGLQVKT